MLQIMLELKVCEGCGGLWLRPQQQQQPYCIACRLRFGSLPCRASKNRAVRKPCTASRLKLVKSQIEVRNA